MDVYFVMKTWVISVHNWCLVLSATVPGWLFSGENFSWSRSIHQNFISST